MTWRQIHEAERQRTFAIVLKTGDEAMASLMEMAKAERLDAAQVTGIGAFQEAVIRYFDWKDKSYHDIPVEEQVEVASLVGDIASGQNGEPVVHIHIVLGRRDGSAVVGHLKRIQDPVSGLALVSLQA